MWPFGRNNVAGRLAGTLGAAAEPYKVSVLTTIVSPISVTSPLTGLRAAMLHVELVERIPLAHQDDMLMEGRRRDTDLYESLGVVVFGDVVTLRDEDGDEITIVVGRARIEPQLPRHGGTPLSRVPPELVPMLAKASGRGVVCYRELTLGESDKIRLKAVVEPSQHVVASGYRSGTRLTYVARDDLAPVVLEEVAGAAGW